MIVRPGYVRNESGRVKISSVVLIVLLAAGIYLGFEIGGILYRKMKLEEAVRQQVSFVGQIEDSAIRQQIQSEVIAMNLPPEARRIGLTRTERPRAIHVTIQYSELVDLLFTKRLFPVRIEITRGY